jgi:Mg-chelatase subunit ChlD
LSRENVAIVSFSSATSSCGMTVESVTTDSGLSFDYNDAREAMARLSSNPIPGGTNIAAGIDEAVGILTGGDIRPFARKTIIVMTDGQWNEGRHPVEAASDAAAAGITVHAITFCDSAEQATMQEVARVGNGEHYHAPDAETLREIYREIAFTLQIILTE